MIPLRKEGMTLEYKIYDFKNMTVETRTREIDLDEMIKHNALLQKLMRDK